MPVIATRAVIAGALLAAVSLFLARVFVWYRSPSLRVVRRSTQSRVGVVVHAAAFVPIWIHARHPQRISDASALLAIVLTLISLPILLWAVVVLGSQWSVAGRINADHQLITTGPYRYLRHPIYTALFGFLLAAGLVFTTLPLLLLAVVIYAVGTALRIRGEESLLREQFGARFEAYAARTPAVVPLVVR